jgi:hypothetical protein
VRNHPCLIPESAQICRNILCLGRCWRYENIEIEGFALHVAVSLYGALKSVRKESELVLIWMDVLCIDQLNNDERTQQVKLMASIYSTAESVAIWLVPEEDDSAVAIDLL